MGTQYLNAYIAAHYLKLHTFPVFCLQPAFATVRYLNVTSGCGSAFRMDPFTGDLVVDGVLTQAQYIVSRIYLHHHL